MKVKKKKRKHPSKESDTSDCCCPWWNGIKSNSTLDYDHSNNVYGLYEFIGWSNQNVSQITEIDFSFWPVNDDDILKLMSKMLEGHSMTTSPSTRHDTSRGNNRSNNSDRLRYIQKLKFHSCAYLTDRGVDFLAKYWNFRGVEIEIKDNAESNSYDENENLNIDESIMRRRKRKQYRPSTKVIEHSLQSPSAASISLQYLNSPLLDLDLSNCPKITNEACRIIGITFTKLKVLNLNNCIDISDNGIVCIMNGCKYLHEIHLKNLAKLQDEALAYIRRNLVLMKVLRIIDIDGCIGFSNEAIIHLLESDTAGTIYQFDLSNCVQIELGIIGLCRHSISNRVKFIKMCHIPRLSDSMMGWIASGCKNLQKIDLSGSGIMNDLTLGYLFDGCKRLKVIKLNHCCALTDKALVALDEEIGRRLEELELVGCQKLTNVSIGRIVKFCPYLRKLNLKGVPMISNESAIPLANSCSSLEYLDLSAQMTSSLPSTDSQTPRVGSEGIFNIGKNCFNLRTLLLDGCTRVDDESIIAIARGCTKLKVLSLKSCYRISNRSLVVIGQNCILLEQLFLSSCKDIDDSGLIGLSYRCHQIVRIDLMGVSQITDNGIVHFAFKSSNLKNINLRDCYRLTDKSLIGLAAFCPFIEDIDMFAVDNLSDKSILALNDSCPQLRSMNVGGSEISDTLLQSLASNLHYCLKVKEKLLLEPLHKSKNVHLRHTKKRLEHRRYICLKCKTIQSAFRNYRNRRLLEAVIEVMKEEKCRKAQKAESANKIVAFFRSINQRQSYLVKRSACLTIQTFFRKVWSQSKKKNEAQRDVLVNLVCDSMAAAEDIIVDAGLDMEYLDLDFSATNIILNWEKLASELVNKEIQQRQEICAVSSLQQFWRRQVIRKEEKHSLMRRKCLKWFSSLVHENKMINITRFAAASTIQKQFRIKQEHQQIIRIIKREQKIEKKRNDAAVKIALFLQSIWRMRQDKALYALLKGIQHTQNNATIIIQSWWRRLKCQFLRNHKAKVVRRWKRIIEYKVTNLRRWEILVQKKTEKSERVAAALIQARFRYIKEKESRLKASNKIASLLPLLLSRKRCRKRLLIQKQNRAACTIQKHIRRMGVRNMIRLEIDAAVRIEKFWRSYTCRRLYKKLCVEKLKLSREMEIQEKDKLNDQRRLKLIQMLFQRTEVKAAILIQDRCRAFLHTLHKQEELRKKQEDEKRKKEIEEERRQAFKAHHDRKHNIKGIAKRYIDETVSYLSDLRTGQIVKDAKQTINQIFNDKSEKQHFVKEMIKYSTLKSRGVSHKNDTIKRFHQSLCEEFKGHNWFDRRCEQVIYTYAMWPNEIFQLRGVWRDNLDFRNKGAISINDFFDHVQETKSVYGTFLFRTVNVSPDKYISFSEYLHVITFFSLLGKLDILKMVFKVECKNNTTYLLLDDWICLLDTMLSNEKIQYPKKGALKAFHRHASTDVHGTKLLFFNDFQRIVNEYPFIIVPIVRLQTKTRQSHLGEKFWSKKSQNLRAATSSLKTDYEQDALQKQFL